MAPVLNALGQLVPGLRAILRTTVPEAFFRSRLTIAWDYHPAQQDIGCVQDGPLKIDVPATWAALTRFHETWDDRLRDECRVIEQVNPDLVLSDISYFALAAAHRAGRRSVALASLAWDEIMAVYRQPEHRAHTALIEQMHACYGLPECLIRVAPAMPLRAFRNPHDVGPIVEALTPERARLRQAVGAADHERLVLVGFGGISLTALPYEQMERMAGYRFLIDGALPKPCLRVHSVQDLDMRFMTVLASADIIMTKPGYSTIVEAVDKRQPVVYVRRYNFGDEQSIVDYLHRHGHGAELSLADFEQGHWQPALERAATPTSPPVPPPSPGTVPAANICAELLMNAHA